MKDLSSKGEFNKASLLRKKNYTLPKRWKTIDEMRKGVKSKLTIDKLDKIEKEQAREIAKEDSNQKARVKNFEEGLKGGLHLPEQRKSVSKQREVNIEKIRRSAIKKARDVVKKNYDLKPLFLRAKLTMRKQFNKAKEK